MNKRQENKFTMYESISTFFRASTETVNSVPMLKDSVDEFGSVRYFSQFVTVDSMTPIISAT
jgi:hypothetical protein